MPTLLPTEKPILIFWIGATAKLPAKCCSVEWPAPLNQKPLTTVQKAGIFFLYMGWAAFLGGIAPYLVMLLLMATHIIDPTLNPVGVGILFLVSIPVFIVLMLVGVFCRFLISD